MDDIVDIGEYRTKIGPTGLCEHRDISMDVCDKTLKCSDCGAFLDAFSVLNRMRHAISGALARIEDERAELEKLRQSCRHLIAARKVEDAWRSRTTVPTCPHCREAIFPDDRLGDNRVSKELAKKRRQNQYG